MLTPVLLYLAALGVLLWRLDGLPPYPYNWESYTIWHVWRTWAPAPDWLTLLTPTDGLMTDSGLGPLTGGPVWLAGLAGLEGLAQLRVPLVVLTALAIPLTWAVGRELSTPAVALVGAALLAVSPVFVLYGRTATIVAVSLLPALIAILALCRVVLASGPSLPWRWVAVLQCALAAGVFAYAPVRLLWPAAFLLALAAIVRDRPRRRQWLVVAALTLITTPTVLLLLTLLTSDLSAPAQVVAGYFRARGEQAVTFGGDAARYAPYLRDGQPGAGGLALMLALVRQNAGDLLGLLADWRTEPTTLQYWSPRGQLWPWPVGLATAAGLVVLVAAAVRGQLHAILWLCLLLTLTLPLLFTSQVHVGRLAPALPLLALTAALGCQAAATALGRIALRFRWPLLPFTRIAFVVGTVALVGSSALATASGYNLLPPADGTTALIATLRDIRPDLGNEAEIALVAPAEWSPAIEATHASVLWLVLRDEYQVIDLSNPAASRISGRPVLYVVGASEALRATINGEMCELTLVAWPDPAAETALDDLLADETVSRVCSDGLSVIVVDR